MEEHETLTKTHLIADIDTMELEYLVTELSFAYVRYSLSVHTE